MWDTHAQTLPPLFAKVLAPRVVRHSTVLMVGDVSATDW